MTAKWTFGLAGKDRRTRQEVQAQPEPGDETFRGDDSPIPAMRRPPGRKDTRRWCKGRVGRRHIPVIQIPTNAFHRVCAWRTSHFANGPQLAYVCCHAEICKVCGKVLREAPFWHGLPQDPRRFLQLEECPAYFPQE